MTLKLSYLITLAGCVTILSSCTQAKHITKHNNVYWQQLGYNEASQGKAPQEIYLAKRASITAKAKQAYHNGWKSGALVYCTPNRAYELGTHGNTYTKICPENLAEILGTSYKRGLARYCKKHTNKTNYNKEKNTLTICVHNNNESSKRDSDETKPI
jgi:hypothetical protein